MYHSIFNVTQKLRMNEIKSERFREIITHV